MLDFRDRAYQQMLSSQNLEQMILEKAGLYIFHLDPYSRIDELRDERTDTQIDLVYRLLSASYFHQRWSGSCERKAEREKEEQKRISKSTRMKTMKK